MKKRLYNRFKNSRIDTDHIVAVVCIILAVSVLAVPAVAQTVDETDTFEDGNTDGWEGDNIALSGDSVEGDYSLLARDGVENQSQNPEWTAGPTLDLQSEFTVQGTSKGVQGGTNQRIGYGLVRQEGETAEGVILLFSEEYGSTFIAENQLEDPSTANLETIGNDFDNTWVEWELYSAGDGTIQAKVWEYNTTEPSEYQISRSMDPESGSFSIFTGITDSSREVYLDSVSVSGQSAETDSTLRLDTGNYLGFGETQDYTVYDLVGENEIRNDVTSSATVTSGNTSIITVNQTENTLTATSDENVSTRVNITATYNGRTDIRQVTVAEQSIANLDVLPFLGRTGAMFLDRGFQMMLVGLLLAVAATRVGGVYAGLGIYQMSLTAGWLIGWVPIGLALVGLFSTLFIGLNIAANIDYSVRR